MKILQKGRMQNGTLIQIEDWSENYKFMGYAATIGAYPTAKHSSEKTLGPQKGAIIRIDLNFENQEDAEEAYTSLIEGKTNLLDYFKFMHDKSFKEFITI